MSCRLPCSTGGGAADARAHANGVQALDLGHVENGVPVDDAQVDGLAAGIAKLRQVWRVNIAEAGETHAQRAKLEESESQRVLTIVGPALHEAT